MLDSDWLIAILFLTNSGLALWICRIFMLTKIKREYSDILYNPTHFPGPLVWQIRQVLTSCTIRHISLVPWFDRLDRFWHPVGCTGCQNLSVKPRDQGNVSDCTGCQNLSNLSNQGTREMCRIVQDVTCATRHISLIPWFDRLNRFWHPVQSDTFPWSVALTD
jgi:hypothetical protein